MHQFVHVAETWSRLAGGYGIAYAIGVDAGSLNLKVSDQIFVQRIGSEDFAILHAVVVQNLAHLDGKVGEVSAVEAYSVPARIAVVDAAFSERTDGIQNSAPESVVSVDEKNKVFSHVGVDVIHECLVFALDGAAVGCDEAMRHSAC